MVLILAHQVDL